MKRADFEHVIAAAAQVTGLEEFVVIGSQLPPEQQDFISENARRALIRASR